MTDAISRSALLEQIVEQKFDWPTGYATGYNDAVRVIREKVWSAPALDVAPVVHARWTDDGECTRCGCTAEYTEYATERYDYDWNENLMPCGVVYHRSYHTTDFCPNCGARMDGEEND